MWYDVLRNIQSKGSKAERPGSLAGLAQARRVHQGQFFTPTDVARLMWSIVEPVMDRVLKDRKVSVLDNSVGSGRLLQFAEPDKHKLFGVDVDAGALQMLGGAAMDAGFECEFEHCGMQNIHPTGFDVALINPPFSVHLEAPSLQGFACTSYGRYGPKTSAVSHAYAVAQALKAADVVVALLPRTFADDLLANERSWLDPQAWAKFHYVFDLPPRTFREEGTDVQVSVIVFGPAGRAGCSVPRLSLNNLDDPLPDLSKLRIYGRGNSHLKVVDVQDDGPSIHLPVTGNTEVKVVHDGRKVKLKYRCGLTMAKVENAILREPVTKMLGDEQRFPRGVRFEGQGVLDLEVHLLQDDPLASFAAFIGAIRKAGGDPVVDPGLMGYLRRACRKTRRQAMPLRHAVFVQDGVAGQDEQIDARPRRPQVADSTVWGSPAMKMEEIYQFKRTDDGRYRFVVKEREYSVSPEDLFERFEVVGGKAESGWQVVHEGLAKAFPREAHAWECRAASLGIDKWMSWGYQYDDLIELALKPVGALAAWDMGLGKARLATALILLNGCKHGLVATEAGLIDEMVMELKGLPIPAQAWQVITKPEQLTELRTINVISYERLRMEVTRQPGNAKTVKRMRKTYAGMLRRRIGVAIFDEGDLLSNPSSDQARACEQVSARKTYVLTATPIANYPRDLAPILAFTAGDGTAAQPWGWRRGKLEQSWIKTMSVAERGIDAFRNTYVCTSWVTKEFEDTLSQGAKREIPRIANLDQYRSMLAPHIKRRIVEEPEVSQWMKIPKETREIVEVPWDHGHLAYYLKVVEEFSSFYQQAKLDGGRGNNLVAILARIRAVSFASDFPQHGVEGFGAYMPLTSKQRWVLDEIESLTEQGKKTILYAENPQQIELLGNELAKRNVDSVRFHGGIPIKRRTFELNDRFRFGPCPNMLATTGVTQKGLNLYQAEEVILLSRSWSATVEEQAIHRVLRPQQKKIARVRYLHLSGGIDVYKNQLVTFKLDSARAGLDWGIPDTENADFLHLDTVIGRFVDDMAKLHKVARHDVRKLVEEMEKGVSYA